LAERELKGPYEILELGDGETIWIRPVSFEYGRLVIHPRWPGAPPEKEILAMRIHVDPESKPYFPYYFDVTSKRLVSGLGPVMEKVIGMGAWLVITKHGVAPKAWFEWRIEKVKPAEVLAGTPLRL